jgi:ribosomal protein S18 acetylase RimI-like enzyme
MALIVEEAKSKEDYIKAWTECMEDVYWFKEQRLFDYNRDEMVQEISRDFNKSKSVFLVAKPEGSERIVGVLGVKLEGKIGVLRRWEPAVPLKERSSGAGEVLVENGLEWLQRKGARKATCMIRYPYNSPETAEWHINLYKKCGFEQRGPEGVQLLADLSHTETPIHPSGLTITTRENYTLENFADFTLKAYASTREDKTIHAWDPFVSIHEEVLKGLRSIKRGKHGLSPPNWWKIALINGEPAGFVVSFMPKHKYRPPYGVIGLIGVFPEFRRRGIGYALVVEMHKCFRKAGCRYAYVGTPKTNEKAINLYKKVGYRPVFEIISLERQLYT